MWIVIHFLVMFNFLLGFHSLNYISFINVFPATLQEIVTAFLECDFVQCFSYKATSGEYRQAFIVRTKRASYLYRSIHPHLASLRLNQDSIPPIVEGKRQSNGLEIPQRRQVWPPPEDNLAHKPEPTVEME